MEEKGKYEGMDIQTKLILNLRDIGHVIRFLYEGRESQKRILILLNKEGEMTQSELTEKLGIQPGSASEVVRKLETAGLIERTPNHLDRRTTDISLTKEGRALAEDVLQKRRIRHQEMFSCLSEEEKNTLLFLTEKLNEDWTERYHEKSIGHKEIRKDGNKVCGNM